MSTKRNQASHPLEQRPLPYEDEVLRRMLNTPPQPHKPKAPPAAKKKSKT